MRKKSHGKQDLPSLRELVYVCHKGAKYTVKQVDAAISVAVLFSREREGRARVNLWGAGASPEARFKRERERGDDHWRSQLRLSNFGTLIG